MSQLADLVPAASSGPSRQRPTYPSAVRNRELSAAQMGSVRDGHQQLERTHRAAHRQPERHRHVHAGSAAGRVRGLARQPRRRTGLRAVGRHAVVGARGPGAPAAVGSGHADRAQRAHPGDRRQRPRPAGHGAGRGHGGPGGADVVDAAGRRSCWRPAARPRWTSAPTRRPTVRCSSTPSWPPLDGQPLGTAQTIPVQVTGFGAVAALLVGAALVLLCVALVVRIVRAIRTGRRPGSPASVRAPAR